MLRECLFHKERSYRWSLGWFKDWLQKVAPRGAYSQKLCQMDSLQKKNSLGEP